MHVRGVRPNQANYVYVVLESTRERKQKRGLMRLQSLKYLPGKHKRHSNTGFSAVKTGMAVR